MLSDLTQNKYFLEEEKVTHVILTLTKTLLDPPWKLPYGTQRVEPDIPLWYIHQVPTKMSSKEDQILFTTGTQPMKKADRTGLVATVGL